tara:strand:+ start:346 stop:618 length:273 start_codon:yes stop_codon:yes gene_type:complete
MAVGDFVNGMITSGTNLDFQPASPNVVCITSFGDWSNYGQMTNGTIVAYLKDHLASAWNQDVNKLFINNTNYLRIVVSGNGAHYSGVQVQ